MELRVFKPTVWSRLSFFIWGTIGAAFLGFILMLLKEGVRINRVPIQISALPLWLGPLAAILLELFVLYHVFFGNRVRFEVEGPSFRYIKKGTIVTQIDNLSSYLGGYSQKTRNNDVVEQNLYLTALDGRTQELQIDCEPLSARQFNKMWALLLERGLRKDVPTLEVQPPQGN